MRIAINGAGIAGPTLAYWLYQFGHEPTLIEKSPHLRTGGYMIDFWGIGYTVAERMGLLPALEEAGYHVEEIRFVDRNGDTVASAPVKALRQLANNRLLSLPRGDLAAAIYRSIQGKVETVFGDSIASLEQHSQGVSTVLEQGEVREFDLVVGADGLHSRVRELVFGSEVRFERTLGFWVAAFELEGYEPRNDLTLVGHSLPGRQIVRFSKRDGSTLVFLVFRDSLLPGPPPTNVIERKAVLWEVFGDGGWECPQILAGMDQVRDVYFDRVSQIRMDRWSSGRVILIGDAAACVSLLAGEGTGLGMTEAYVLAGELQRARGDYAAAFRSYESMLRGFIAGKQQSALRLASSFAPRSHTSIWLRNMGLRLLRFPLIARWLVGPNLTDGFDLPEYSAYDLPEPGMPKMHTSEGRGEGCTNAEPNDARQRGAGA